MHTQTTRLMSKLLGCALCAAALLPVAAGAGVTDIATQPLAQPAANVPPNVMVLFDDSGSMMQQYTPDYIGRWVSSDSNALCFDSLDSGGSINSTLQNCEPGDPPLMSPQFNFQYYNPTITYLPAVNYDGTSMPSMTAAYTSNWTAVPTDAVSTSGVNSFRTDTLHMFPASSQPLVTTSNLASNFPDREWCNSASASTTYPNSSCRTNSNYSYPDGTYGYGKTSTGALRYTYGAPYYYLITTTEYCTDLTLSNCIGSPSSPVTSPTTVGGVKYSVPAPVRYCNSTSLNNCEQNFTGSYTRPKFTGIWNTTAVSQATATATITVGSQTNSSGAIQNVTANGVNLFGPGYPSGVVSLAPGPINTTTVASNIKLAINNGTATNGGYTATSSGSAVTIYAGTSTTCTPADCTQPNGYVVNVVSTPGTPVTPATGTLTVSSISSSSAKFTSIQVNGTEILGATVSPGTTNTTTMATALKNQINNYTATSGYSATSSGSTVTIKAPSGTGSEQNGHSISESDSRVSVSTTNMAGGITPGVINTSATNFTGGQNAAAAGRTGVGLFTRTSIVSGQNYPLYAGRTDCGKVTSGVCSYSEEMTNFANWYAYYRTRNTMTKTAIGRAFVGITSAFRVGMVTLNPGSTVSSSKYLAVDDFTSGAGNQKDNWYTHIYSVDNGGGTPTREALSRVGQYFAGLGSTGSPRLAKGMDASPIQYACQANYTVLVTDGYWNGNAGQTVTGGSIGNQDNTDSGYHTRAIGAYDGGLSGSTNTLADTAMYYYQTDLRSDLADEVPTTATDPNPAQHMDLFAVGLGLAGQLTYDPNYLNETATTGGDFWNIKQGSQNWPVPVSDGETALDDLWHAAVNGHGQYFTARDPNTLSNALATALNSVAARVGAGAAAATSNLQPVAGDNFAFTAQYETVAWDGDLTARTIDLSTGIVSYATLWSASALLDQRTPYDRTIYTFDPTDTGSTGNLLKSFCWPGAYASGNYPACNDGAELSAADMANFNPLTLTQAAAWATDGSGRTTSATAQNLVDYLRGDVSNETTGGTASTDLYRNRAHLLGDIVDAQPAYMRTAPFGYNSGSYAGTDPNYAAFQASTASRPGTVYAAANDGMLHAFNTQGPGGEIYYQTAGIATQTTSDDSFTGSLVTSPTTGQGSERWAYVPSMIMQNLQNLANVPYSHIYFADGSPQIGDVCFGHTLSTPCAAATNWRTILVAGLNGGGRGYYALDVTDPTNPKGLWEFSAKSGTPCLTDAQANSGSFFQDCNLGYSFGNPLIVKRPVDGKWVVIVSSGYNNVNPGNGQGYLYILDAQSGAILQRIGTGVGCDGVSTVSPCVSGTVDPSGLNRINAWVNNAYYDNTALRVYGVDLKGNVWRFQLDPTGYGYAQTSAAPYTAFKLETLKDPSGVAQPLTTKPELADVNGHSVVYVATGKMLGTSDLTTTQVQSIYALRDDITSTALPDVRSSGGFVQQTLSAISGSNPPARTTTNNTVNFATNLGWWVDLPDSGERVNVDPQLQLGTIIVASNVPTTDACVAGGYSWVNFLNYATGAYVTGASANMASTKIAGSLVVGINVAQLPGGAVKAIVTTADNQQLTQTTPVASAAVQGRRVSWRELISQ
ncbi:MAG TPA: PilC/PilY family type IV pilus protein [Burkholderiales bacterium]|nr:PilC/PilY family type IV pilus protein [Burkholderiales bacterium]